MRQGDAHFAPPALLALAHESMMSYLEIIAAQL
jgi:hypothetical protein